MADRDIDQDYQLYQVLQRRHLFEKPVEFLLKVRCKDGRLREIWVPKSKVVATAFGRSLLRDFNKTKVAERGIDMYIGKRRSLTSQSSEKLKDGSDSAKDVPENGQTNNNNSSGNIRPHQMISVASSNKSLKVNLASKTRSNSSGVRKVKTRVLVGHKQNVNNTSNKNSVRLFKNSRNLERLLNKSKKIKSDTSTNISNYNSTNSVTLTTAGSEKCNKNESLSKISSNISKRIHAETSHADQPQSNCKIPKLGNTDQLYNFCTNEAVCQSCMTRCPMRHQAGHPNPPTSLSDTTASHQQFRCHASVSLSSNCSCIKCFCPHTRDDTKTGQCVHLPSANVVIESFATERRVSIRQTESAFRLKEISVRKFSGFVHLVLGSETSSKRVLKNSFNPKVFQEACTVLQNLTQDDCRVVLLSGFGNTFCSGMDLSYLLHSELDRKTAAKNMTEALRDFVNLLITFTKPIIVAVNGLATGLGTAMLPLCDIVYASDKASFSCPYTSLAQTPEACSSYTFPKIMGLAMANEMLIGGRRITALEAHQIGLITQVFWPENLLGEVMPRVQILAQQSAKAIECTKALIRCQEKVKLEFVNQSECRLLADRWFSSECQKAMKIFIENQANSL